MDTASSPTPIYVDYPSPFAGKDLQAKVQELCDREELRELVSAYAHRMAQGVPVGDMFCDDGAYVNHGVPGKGTWEIRGREQLDAYWRDRAPPHPLPMIHNHLIQIDGDEATGICSMELRLSAKDVSVIASTTYDDRYARVDGVWKFKERAVRVFHWVPLHQGWAEAQAVE